jgi:hypothetical protein
MKQKNTTTKKKKYNENYRKKLLDNNSVYKFKDEDDDDLLEDENITEVNFNYDDNDETHSISEISEDIDVEDEDEEVIEEKPVKKDKKVTDKTKYYVEPKKFDEEIMKYYDSGEMSDELALMVSKISHKLSYAPNFINYSYREEMVGDGLIRMMKALIAKKYNREKGTNPFSYFTRIAFNAFRNRIKKEKHIHETHEKYQKELMFMSDHYNNMFKNNNIHIMKERNRER